MSLFFAFNFSFLSAALLIALSVLFLVELIYLYAIYNRLPHYARLVKSGRVVYADELPSVSVVVYAHAEDADGVLQLIPQLMKQQYPCYEVIVVCDGVAHDMEKAIAAYECEHSNLYQTFVPETVYNVSRKKLGITLGIKAAKNDVVLVTDAHCMPTSDRWIYSMARNFVKGVDIVLGHTRMRCNSPREKWHFATFDRITFSMRYMAYALMSAPYMGMSGNLAYRKELFFANKGFSSTLNLHFGDDDLLVNEMSTRYNTRVELSPESVVESCYENNSEAWSELRMRYNFTAHYRRSSSKFVFLLETVLHYLFLLCGIGVAIFSLPNLIGIAAVALVWLIHWLLTWRVYRAGMKSLGERGISQLVPFYQFLRPLYSCYYAWMGKRAGNRNFTWQYLR